MNAFSQDPIVAIATPPGRGAVGIVRVSGQNLAPLIQAICGRELKPRDATYLPFLDAKGQAIDHGLALFFLLHIRSRVKMYWSCKRMADQW